MARARNIKPAIMDNDVLATLAPLTRLLFIYLWMLADREGRLEDRPKRIGAQALPFDRDADVPAMLDDLAAAGFITRYTVDGLALILIDKFSKHQSPHIREQNSSLPAPLTSQDEIQICATRAVTEHNLGSDKAVPCTNPGSVEASPRSPDSLIPDSLIPDTGLGTVQHFPAAGTVVTDDCPHQKIIDAFHTALPTARRVKVWTPSRKQLLKARWREDRKRQSLGWWEKFFAYVADSEFLTGQATSPGRKPFEISLEWLLKAERFAEVIEGKFHDNAREAA